VALAGRSVSDKRTVLDIALEHARARTALALLVADDPGIFPAHGLGQITLSILEKLRVADGKAVGLTDFFGLETLERSDDNALSGG
jgi:hypothetical protein